MSVSRSFCICLLANRSAQLHVRSYQVSRACHVQIPLDGPAQTLSPTSPRALSGRVRPGPVRDRIVEFGTYL